MNLTLQFAQPHVIAACDVTFGARRRLTVVAAPVKLRVTRRWAAIGTARWRAVIAALVNACGTRRRAVLSAARWRRQAVAFGLAARILARGTPYRTPLKLARRRRAMRKLRGAGQRRRTSKTFALTFALSRRGPRGRRRRQRRRRRLRHRLRRLVERIGTRSIAALNAARHSALDASWGDRPADDGAIGGSDANILRSRCSDRAAYEDQRHQP